MTDKEIFEKLEAEIERLKNYENENVTSSDTRFGWIHGKTFALTSIRVLLDSMQKEPKECMYSKDNYTDEDRKVLCNGCAEECEYKSTTEEKKFEISDACLIQYASREAGIKAHAEEYSFNIESELFQQLTPEQQKLWRKEIEQAVLSGGYCGLELANDRRYDKQEPVSEDLESAAKNHSKEIFNGILVEDNIEAYKAGAKWKEQQMMAKAVDAVVKVDAGGYPYIPQMELYDYDKDIPLAKEGDKYKVILIKE